MFFDGSSKGNLWAAGARGVILDSEGKEEFLYEWGLGIKSNNQAEMLEAFLGIKLLKTIQIQEAIVIGDYELIIRALCQKSNP